MGLRGILYRLILHKDGGPPIQNRRSRLRFANHIRLGHGVYLDQDYHACPRGIELGKNTIIMHGQS